MYDFFCNLIVQSACYKVANSVDFFQFSLPFLLIKQNFWSFQVFISFSVTFCRLENLVDLNVSFNHIIVGLTVACDFIV